MATTTATQIQQLYVGLLGRAADQGGLNWWADQVTTGGKTLEDVRASFVTSTEYTTTYGAAATRADLVTSIYQNLFERTPSADEVKYWAETDTRPADQLVAAFIEFAGAADQAVINNKTFVAQTYTDTVGADFNAKGAAEVIANVDGTAASVSAATAAIANGALAGQVPALGLVNAVVAANAAQTTFETDNKAALDTVNAALKAPTDTKVAFGTELLNVTTQAGSERDAVLTQKYTTYAANGTPNTTTSVAGTDTTVLLAQQKVYADATAKDYNGLTSTQKSLADKYVAALDAQVKAAGAVATLAEKAGAVAGLATDTKAVAGFADAALKAALGLTGTGSAAAADALAVYTAYETGAKAAGTFVGTAAELRTLIDTKLGGSDYYATFKAVVVKDAAASDATGLAATALSNLTTTGTIAEKANAVAYVNDLTTQTTYSKIVADVQKADVTIASAKALADAYQVKTDAAGPTGTAATALKAFNDAHTDTVAIHSLTADTAGTGTTAAPIKDVFYFANKVTTSNDLKIGSFGAGDSLVVGTGLDYNKGALTAGDNNKAEFFLVQQGKDTLVVLETANYGSSDVAKAADGTLASNGLDHAAVITLTGVNVTDLNVANGVISHVA